MRPATLAPSFQSAPDTAMPTNVPLIAPHADVPAMKPMLRGSGRIHSPNAHPPTPPPVAKIHVTVVCVANDQSLSFSRVYCHCVPAMATPSTPPSTRPVAIDEGTPR